MTLLDTAHFAVLIRGSQTWDLLVGIPEAELLN